MFHDKFLPQGNQFVFFLEENDPFRKYWLQKELSKAVQGRKRRYDVLVFDNEQL